MGSGRLGTRYVVTTHLNNGAATEENTKTMFLIPGTPKAQTNQCHAIATTGVNMH